MNAEDTTQNTPEDDGPQPPTGGGARRMTRSRDDRVIGGVCGGLGRYFNTDPLFFRIGAIALAFLGGAGLLLYLAALLLMPAEESGAAVVSAPGAGRNRALVIAGVVVLLIVAWPFLLGGGVLAAGIVIPLAILVGAGVLVWWLVSGEGPSGEPKDIARRAALGVGVLILCGLVAFGGAFAAAAGPDWLVAAAGDRRRRGHLAGAFLKPVRWLVLPAVALALAAGTVAAAGIDLDGGVGEREYRPASAPTCRIDTSSAWVSWWSTCATPTCPPGDVPLDLDVGIGQARVIVPEDVCVATDAGHRRGQRQLLRPRPRAASTWTSTSDPEAESDSTRMLLDAQIGLGELRVSHDDFWDHDERTSAPATTGSIRMRAATRPAQPRGRVQTAGPDIRALVAGLAVLALGGAAAGSRARCDRPELRRVRARRLRRRGGDPAGQRLAGAMKADERRLAPGRDRCARPSGGWLGGVCAGIARRYGVDRALVRLAFVIAAAAGGVGVALYVLAWLVVPAGSGHGTPTAADRPRCGRGGARHRPAAAERAAHLSRARHLVLRRDRLAAGADRERRRADLARLAASLGPRPGATGGAAPPTLLEQAKPSSRAASRARPRRRISRTGHRHRPRDRGRLRVPAGHRRAQRGPRRAARGDRGGGGARRDLRALGGAAGALAHRGALRAHPLPGARRGGRAPARLGAADARAGAALGRPAGGGRAGAPPGARAARLAGGAPGPRAGGPAGAGAGGRRGRGRGATTACRSRWWWSATASSMPAARPWWPRRARR